MKIKISDGWRLVIGTVLVIGLYVGYVAWVDRRMERDSARINHQIQLQKVKFISNYPGLVVADVNCNASDDAYRWCSFPLNGHAAWAICHPIYGCFTQYR